MCRSQGLAYHASLSLNDIRIPMPSGVPLPSMPIARASAGGSVQSIFSSTSRIATRDQADPYCRDAKLKMLCIIQSAIQCNERCQNEFDHD